MPRLSVSAGVALTVVTLASFAPETLVFSIFSRFLEIPACADDFRGLGSGASFFFNLLAGGALELLDCLVLPLEALDSSLRDVAVESEGELIAYLVGLFRFAALPRSVDESYGAFIVLLERFFRVPDLRVLPFDFRLFRETAPASFSVLALLTTTALLSTLALRSFDLKAGFEDSRELDFDALILLLLAGDPLELLAFLDVRLKALLVCDLDKASDRWECALIFFVLAIRIMGVSWRPAVTLASETLADLVLELSVRLPCPLVCMDDF